ncbi:aminotransferase [Kiloniella spongiae]|uniref:Aminotransferase n=1 Tax=Kiloniella spongiae TaxID=1489064 RepID=A0A0H2ME26_9PROT|nr:aminotransferase [Kiloniella spongiae]KLN60436.1 aminotransferase [Kiloniella spongiae]
MKDANSVLSSYSTTVFEVMSQLALEHDAINLGQGFPDEDGPEELRKIAADSLMEGPNQYPSMMGIPELRQAIADHDKRFYGINLDWKTEVMVTSGATEALADCLFGLIEPGDEVVVLEPSYDCYIPLIKRAGGIPVIVPMSAPDWKLPIEELDEALTHETKLIIINSPMNPTGKAFHWDELEALAELCLRYDIYAVCDEVYEHLIFDGRKHYPLITLPGMRDRTVRIGSAGKSFALTGWKVGYVCGAPDVLTPIIKAHQFTTFTTPPNLQKAVAAGLSKDQSYFDNLTKDLETKRDYLAKALSDIGFDVLPCDGTYFVTVDIRGVHNGRDEEFCRYITTEAKVAAIPVSVFYDIEGPSNLVRFCFSKRMEVLEEAMKRLEKALS